MSINARFASKQNISHASHAGSLLQKVTTSISGLDLVSCAPVTVSCTRSSTGVAVPWWCRRIFTTVANPSCRYLHHDCAQIVVIASEDLHAIWVLYHVSGIKYFNFLSEFATQISHSSAASSLIPPTAVTSYATW